MIFFFLKSEQEFIRLWYHENCRVYQDRLINDEDRNWFSDLLKNKILENFGDEYVSLVTGEIILFSDFVESESYVRVTSTSEVNIQIIYFIILIQPLTTNINCQCLKKYSYFWWKKNTCFPFYCLVIYLGSLAY